MPICDPMRTMTTGFEVYKDRAGEFRWRLNADNHKTIAAASEGYVAKHDSIHAIDILRRWDGNVSMYKDAKGEWRWRLAHSNGNIIATSGEGYVARSDCEYGLALAQNTARTADIHEIE